MFGQKLLVPSVQSFRMCETLKISRFCIQTFDPVFAGKQFVSDWHDLRCFHALTVTLVECIVKVQRYTLIGPKL